MTKLLVFVALAIIVQLAENQYEVIAVSQPVSIKKRSIDNTVGGISIEHPLQATVYAYRRGKMKLLVPFEINVVPMNSFQPERPPSRGFPISGQIRPQQNPSYIPNYANQNQYQQHTPTYYGSVQTMYPSYNQYYQPVQIRPPYYVPSVPVGGGYDARNTRPFPQYRPAPAYTQPGYQRFPQYRPAIQQHNSTNPLPNGNNTVNNIGSQVNTTSNPPNTSPIETSTISEIHTTTTAGPEINPENPPNSNVNPEMPPNQDTMPETPLNPEAPHQPEVNPELPFNQDTPPETPSNPEAPHNPEVNPEVPTNPEMPSNVETSTTTEIPRNPEANVETNPDAHKDAPPNPEVPPAAETEIPEVQNMIRSGFERRGTNPNSEPKSESELKNEEANRVNAELNGLINESSYNQPENYDPNGETRDSIISGDIHSNDKLKEQTMIEQPIEQYRF